VTSISSAPGSFQTNNSNSNSTDGNLHWSGFGPMTTPEMVIQLFSPYVKVDELVPKSGFVFVLDTSDPEGSHRAKEALTEVMVGGGHLRINPAVRRSKNQFASNDTASAHRPPGTTAPAAPLPRDALGQRLTITLYVTIEAIQHTETCLLLGMVQVMQSREKN